MGDMDPGEVAAMYEDGGDAVILVARGLSDDQRCEAVNRLLARVKTSHSPMRWLASVGVVLALALSGLAQLSEDVTHTALQLH